MKYEVIRGCENCGNQDFTELTKIQSAFNLFSSQELWDKPCSKCGSKDCQSLGHSPPPIDKELLNLWGQDLKLSFSQQDEEIVLANFDDLYILLKNIDEKKYLKKKIDVLVAAVCVLLFDNVALEEHYSEKEIIERAKIAEIVRPELIKRKKRVLDAGDMVYNYIKEVVYPEIGLDENN